MVVVAVERGPGGRRGAMRGAQVRRPPRIRRVGIALAAYEPDNRYMAEQLRSIQHQTFPDWVCFITCDSPVETIVDDPAIRPFTSDGRFRWVNNPSRLGHLGNFERAIQLCAADGVDAIACSDQDDVWYPTKLERSVRALEEAGGLSLVHSDMHLLEAGRIVPQTGWQVEQRVVKYVRPRHLIVRNVVAGAGMLFDAELARRYPRIPTGAGFHDHWYGLVASFHGGVHPIDEPLYAYRQHGANVVGVNPFRSVLTLPRDRSWSNVARKCLTEWRKSHELARAAQTEGLRLRFYDRLLFLSPWDAGMGVGLLGARHIVDDPNLVRMSLARAVGKALWVAGLLLGRRSRSMPRSLRERPLAPTRRAGAVSRAETAGDAPGVLRRSP